MKEFTRLEWDHMDAIDDEIGRRLDAIESEEKVRILYACESGSRAWGFPSADSDYDVRFIYAHPPDWYLSIDLEDKRDVIERPILDELDVSGWDIRKALQLLRKSNPPLLEWLTSPIIYRQVPETAEKLRSAIAEFYSPISSYHHYLNMARNNLREYMKLDVVNIKKYFYILRPLLAIKWIVEDNGPVPMEFEKLVSGVVESEPVRRAIAELVHRKRSGQEMDDQPRIGVISDFIDQQFDILSAAAPTVRPKPDPEPLNRLFREIVG